MVEFKRLVSFSSFSLIFIVIHSFVSAQVKQQLVVYGLQAPVELIRDKWGVNHIYANNQHDLFFAQGYCAAKDRLFQFELWRRQATGTLAEILGVQELKRDIGARLFLFRGDIKKELSHYHPDGVSIINDYVDGVNAYIDEVLKNPDQLPVEFKFLDCKPGKWTPEIVISRHQGRLGNVNQELNIGRSVAKLGQDKVKDLMWFHPKIPDLTLDVSITDSLLSKDILELYNVFHTPIKFQKKNTASTSFQQNTLPVEQDTEGSNNWIVSGSKTPTGYPLLANDPHRSISLPSLRYMVHLVAPGMECDRGR